MKHVHKLNVSTIIQNWKSITSVSSNLSYFETGCICFWTSQYSNRIRTTQLCIRVYFYIWHMYEYTDDTLIYRHKNVCIICMPNLFITLWCLHWERTIGFRCFRPLFILFLFFYLLFSNAKWVETQTFSVVVYPTQNIVILFVSKVELKSHEMKNMCNFLINWNDYMNGWIQNRW
jgi:hypothetical protein